DVAILLDLQPDGIQVRQWAPGCVAFPIVRIPREDYIRAGFLLGQTKWTQDCHLFTRRLGRENCHLIKESLEASHRRRESDRDAEGSGHLCLNELVARAERVGRRGMDGG